MTSKSALITVAYSMDFRILFEALCLISDSGLLNSISSCNCKTHFYLVSLFLITVPYPYPYPGKVHFFCFYIDLIFQLYIFCFLSLSHPSLPFLFFLPSSDFRPFWNFSLCTFDFALQLSCLFYEAIGLLILYPCTRTSWSFPFSPGISLNKKRLLHVREHTTVCDYNSRLWHTI